MKMRPAISPCPDEKMLACTVLESNRFYGGSGIALAGKCLFDLKGTPMPMMKPETWLFTQNLARTGRLNSLVPPVDWLLLRRRSKIYGVKCGDEMIKRPMRI